MKSPIVGGINGDEGVGVADIVELVRTELEEEVVRPCAEVVLILNTEELETKEELVVLETI